MLHRIKNMDRRDRMERIMKFQRKVLAFVCDPATPLSLDEATITAAFDNAGDWVWGKMKKKSGDKSDLCKDLERAIQYCINNPAEAQQLLAAFDHDMEFYDYLNDAAFQFHYSVILSEEAKEVIKPVMVAFYTDLLASGYPEAIQGDKKSFNRDEFLKAFYASNSDLRVCPACDGPRADTIDNKTYADADHFLPKSEHPFLSVHWANLVPLCIYCNRPIKGSRDPIHDPNDSPLVNSFHPYGRPAIDHIDVRISRTDSGERRLRITDRNHHPSRRVESLNRVFELEARWPDRLKDAIESIIEELLGAGERLERSGVVLNDDELRIELESMLTRKENRLGRGHWYLLHTSYLRHALADNNEFDELFAQFRRL